MRPRILITNDDSIDARGIRQLADCAAAYGEVFIVAPLTEQSAQSHAINIKTGFAIERYADFAHEAYRCASTPADCVRAAHFALKKPFDFVISGINNGFNVGEDIAYSGTVAATVEAAFLGKKAIAVSAYPGAESLDAGVLAEIAEFFKTRQLFCFCDVYNINIPERPRGIMITRQGQTHFDTAFVRDGDLWRQVGKAHFELERTERTDVWAVFNGYVSITPLVVERTDYEAFNKLTDLS
ncbi:MAG TPA: 5'/3'-nucleotidase SurE [Acholeplasmataceae bacterium]|jgi:5'-nucleotidase|nr:5'/3'-nucleotidase SurE [Acholeplasmataceae bacterium]